MGHLFDRLRRLIRERFSRDINFVQLNPYSDSEESPIVDLVIRNRKARKIISGDSLIVPIHSTEALIGAAVLEDGITLTEQESDQIVEVVDLLLGDYLEMSEKLERAKQLEVHLSAKLDRANVVYLHEVKTKNKPLQEQIRVGRDQGPFLTQILIEGRPGIPFKEIALDIHERSGRSSFISWDDLDSTKVTKSTDLTELGPITIYIPNLAQLTPGEQAVLDQYILEGMGESTPRIMASVQSPLMDLVEKGQVRSTLAFYFSKVHLKIPPLVERKEDILELVDFFSKAHSQGHKDVTSYGLETLSYLTEYDWPGNEKELETEVQKIVEQPAPEKYGVENLPAKIVGAEAKQLYRLAKAKTNLKEATDELEKKMVTNALTRSGGNKSEASRLLGLSRSALLEKLGRIEKPGGSSSEP
jgi:DNA-binding protein Fis